MRGMLRIASSRAPYQRAGIGFATKGPQDVDIRELDGERLLRLIKDPVLKIKVGQEDGSFTPLPIIPEDFPVELAQVMIDGCVAELGSLEAALDVTALPSLAIDVDSRFVKAGVSSLDELFDKLATTAAEKWRLELDYNELREHADRETAELQRCAAALMERDNELRLSRERVAELEAAVNAASSSQPAAEEQPQETKPAPRKAAAKKG